MKPLTNMPTSPASGTDENLDRDLARLEDVLCQELDHYRDLLDLMLQEKDVLTANRAEELSELLEGQRRVLEETKRLEPDRMAALEMVGRRLGLTDPPTLRSLAEQLQGADRQRIDSLRQALAHVVPRVDQVSRINVLLIRNSMSFISATVRAILEESSPRVVTNAAGAQMTPPGQGPAWTDRCA